jgi:hypothetical protein
MNKTELDTKDSDADYPLVLLKEELNDYLPFLSVDYVVCDVCNKKVRTRDFPYHIEQVHYDPPTRVWSKGPKAGWRRKRRQLERIVL